MFSVHVCVFVYMRVCVCVCVCVCVRNVTHSIFSVRLCLNKHDHISVCLNITVKEQEACILGTRASRDWETRARYQPETTEHQTYANSLKQTQIKLTEQQQNCSFNNKINTGRRVPQLPQGIISTSKDTGKLSEFYSGKEANYLESMHNKSEAANKAKEALRLREAAKKAKEALRERRNVQASASTKGVTFPTHPRQTSRRFTQTGKLLPDITVRASSAVALSAAGSSHTRMMNDKSYTKRMYGLDVTRHPDN